MYFVINRYISGGVSDLRFQVSSRSLVGRKYLGQEYQGQCTGGDKGMWFKGDHSDFFSSKIKEDDTEEFEDLAKNSMYHSL